MMQVGTNQSTTYHSQPPPVANAGGQTARSSSTSRQGTSQYDNEQLANIRPRLCTLRKWPHYDGYGVHLARNQHWLGLRIGDVEPNSPAESGGLLREDVVLAVNGHHVEKDDFFVILSFIQHELEDDQIRFLVVDPQSADIARRHQIKIEENFPNCIRMETTTFTVSPEQLLYAQWQTNNLRDPTTAQNTVHLGPATPHATHPPATNVTAERPPRKSSRDAREDVFTFLPYSDHALENGKSLLDIFLEPDSKSSAARRQDLSPRPARPLPHTTASAAAADDEVEDDVQNNGEKQLKEKKSGSNIRDGVKNLVKSGLDNIKSVLPTHRRDSREKDDVPEPKRKESVESVESAPRTPDSPSLIDKLKNRFKRATSPPNATDPATNKDQPTNYEPLWKASSEKPQDTNNNLKQEPRMCSLSLRPGIDNIGISLQPDKDFGHIIKQVDPNSPAARAGIERDDCIITLNETPLLNIPYDDVLTTLKRSRNEPNLDFLVANKSFLLRTSPTQFLPRDVSAISSAQVMPSSNLPAKDPTSSQNPNDTLEYLYNKYAAEPKSLADDSANNRRPKETVSTTTNVPVDERIPAKSESIDPYLPKQQSGQIIRGVGPATADRTSWSSTGDKVPENMPVPATGDSSSRGRRTDSQEGKGRDSSLEDSFKPLQVGITNPTAAQQSGNASPNLPRSVPADETQRTSRTTSSTGQRDSSPAAIPIVEAVAPRPADQRPVSPSSKPSGSSLQKLAETIPVVPVATAATASQDQSDASSHPALQLGPTKAMSVVSKPSKAPPPPLPTSHYEDTDDDDLSDISEESREDDNSDSINAKVGQLSSLPSSTNRSDTYAKNSTSAATTKSDTNPPLVNTRPVVQARRLEHSDSDDTSSAHDSHLAKLSAVETFYSPDESVEIGEESEEEKSEPTTPDLASQSPSKPGGALVNLPKAAPAPARQPASMDTQHDSDEDEDEDEGDGSDRERDSDESESTDTVKKVPSSDKMALAKIPIGELKDYGYELHNIQLMQPTETSPVGLKLTKQQDPLQFVITAVAKGTKADFAGLKVNDWLIKIEDEDVRLLEFSEVSQEIRELLTHAGLINMVVARKRTSSNSPAVRKENPPSTASVASSRSGSVSRSQGVPSLLTTDITRDTPNNDQVRFTPEQPTSTSTSSQSARVAPVERDTEVKATRVSAPLSVGLTNPIPDETAATRPPRSDSQSPSRSPTREYPIHQETKSLAKSQASDQYDPKDVRHVVLKEALGLDFNSFIPEGDSQTQTHFISNVQKNSVADKAGLRDGDRILTVNGVDVTNAIHENVRQMMQKKKPLQLTVVNDPTYLELIENVKQPQSKKDDVQENKYSNPPDYESIDQRGSASVRGMIGSVSDSGTESALARPKSVSPAPMEEDLSEHLQPLFTDEKGTVQAKHCILRKDPGYNGYGLLLRYQNNLHIIDQVEENSPAYNAGLREDDVIIFVDKKNVEQMTHDDVKISIRKLSTSNTDIDLVLIRKGDVPRYRTYQQGHRIDWQPILQDKNASIQTEPRAASVASSTNESSSTARKSSSESSALPSTKQAAPAPPTATAAAAATPTLPAGTRLCVLQPSPERTAGFALSGKSGPPFVICQIEKNSPAEKAGLLLNDALISIDGKSVSSATYEETVKLIKEGLQRKAVELVVLAQTNVNQDTLNRTKMGLEQAKISAASTDSSVAGGDSSNRGTNAVEEYQKQRNKELSYTLRLCHLHAANNGDGSQSPTFGFELSEDPDNEYPLILRVESQSPAEGAGLQSRDILLRINEKKTKGLGYDKIKKEIEKAKRDGRLEMLVVDQETFDYCKRTKKPMKEPEMKVKHIFPKSRSSASFHKLQLAAAATGTSVSSKDSLEQSNNHDDQWSSYQPTFSLSRSDLPAFQETHSDEEEDEPASPDTSARQSQPTASFHLSPPSRSPVNASAQEQDVPLRFANPSPSTSNQRGAAASANTNTASSAQATSARPAAQDAKGAKSKHLPQAISNLFHKIGHSKSSKRS